MNLFTAYLQHFSQTLWEISWEVTILSGLVAFISLFSWKSSPNFRYWLWCIILFRLCIPFALKMPIGLGDDIQTMVKSLPDYIIEEPKYIPSTSLFESGSSLSPLIKNASLHQGSELLKIPDQNISLNSISMSTLFSLLWFGLIITISMLIIVRVSSVRKLLKVSCKIERPDLIELCNRLQKILRIRRPIELRFFISKHAVGPVSTGIFRIVVYLPLQIVDTWDEKDVEPVLLHELTHIKRMDILVNWFQIFIQIIYFFHPVVWYVNRKIRHLREDACDDEAIRLIGMKHNSYAGSMLRIVKESISDSEPLFWAIGFTENRSLLAKRIARIVSAKYRNRPELTRFSIVLLTAIAISCIALASGKSENQNKAVFPS